MRISSSSRACASPSKWPLALRLASCRAVSDDPCCFCPLCFHSLPQEGWSIHLQRIWQGSRRRLAMTRSIVINEEEDEGFLLQMQTQDSH